MTIAAILRQEAFMDWYLKVLKKYADFQGRASRSEYWYFALFSFLIAMSLAVITYFVHVLSFLYFLYVLGVLIPSLAVGVRRLHDIGKSGFWCFIGLVPILGGLYLLFLVCQPSQSGSNKYGSTAA
jgi:uncharacterized membrane protein YhaH (DUF805 family)